MRWKILFVLFLARMSMAVQFAAIGAVGPVYMDAFAIDAAGLGFLIGAYFLPGVVVAMPGGKLGAAFGDKRILCVGLAMMALGAALMAGVGGWGAQVAGRIIAGAGGVLLNVVMTKMVADWFAGREITTAMAIFVNSWPAGIAVALVAIPSLVGAVGLAGATWGVGGFALTGLCLVALFYRSPPGAPAAMAIRGVFPRGSALGAIIAAGLAWGLFNAAFGMVFSFGPANLVERGTALTEASALTSILIWCVMVCGIAGGVVSDVTGRPMVLFFVATLLNIAGMLWFPAAGSVTAALVFLGVTFGLPTGIYMTLAARALRPEERALGMGLFFTVYYLVFSVAPYFGGVLIDLRGTTAAAFEYGAALLALTMLSVLAWQGFQRQRRPATA